MAFVGDDLNIGSWFQTGVIGEVGDMEGFSTRQVSTTQYPETLNFPADMPPDPSYPGSAPFVLTGEYYIDIDDLQHFQLWLWNSASGSLVYTDEMVFEDMEEAEGYLPPMVRWIFSHVLTDQFITITNNDRPVLQPETTSEETKTAEPVQSPTTRRLYLGVRAAGSFNTYATLVAGGYEAGTSQGFSLDGAVLVDFRIFRFLGLQAEAIFNFDTFKVAKIVNNSYRTTDRFSAMSLMLPLLVKVPVDIGKFTVSPFVGAYYILPLGTLKMTPESPQGSDASYSYKTNPALGFLVGVEASLAMGPGEIFTDFRFGRDIGTTVANGGNGVQYVRSRIGLSVGYKFMIWGRK
jgi:hypothetical protein